jgi:hypothetical protein
MMYTSLSEAKKANSPTADSLPPFYYLENFQQLLVSVVAQYADILSPAEAAFAKAFTALETPGQALMVRLYSRRGPLVRSDKISYREIPDIEAHLTYLASHEWVQLNPPTEREQLLAKLTKAELVNWFGLSPQSGRLNLLAELHCSGAEILARVPFTFIAPLHRQTLQTFMDLFFGNRYQDFSTFVVSQLGHIRYPAYTLEENSRFFPHRTALDQFICLANLRDDFHALDLSTTTAETLLGLAAKIPALAVDDPLKTRADRLRNKIARQLERLSRAGDAIALYGQSSLPPARERRARLLFQQGDQVACHQLCVAMQLTPADYSEDYFAEQFIPRCLKKMGSTHAPSKAPASPLAITQMLLDGRPGEGLEKGVARVISENGSEAFHLENWLFNALFGLFFWECIFLPVRGAFMHPFQTRPADLYDSQFGQRRRTSIEQVFSRLQQEDHLHDRLEETWQQHFGSANPFVGWMDEGNALLHRSLRHIPIRHLDKIFRRMLIDLRNHTSGFPDLLVLHNDGGYELVEVKGPGDQLRANQIQWLNFFARENIPASVLRVDWPA